METVGLSVWSNLVITIAAIGNLLLFVALIVVAFKMKALITETVNKAVADALERVQPLLDKTAKLTDQVSGIVETVGPRLERIVTETESTVQSVSANVKTTSHLVTNNVTRPVTRVAAALAGLERGFTTFRAKKRESR